MIKNVIKVFFSNGILAVLGIVISFLFPLILDIGDYAFYQKYLLYMTYLHFLHLGMPSGMYLNYAGKNYKTIDKKQYKSEVTLLIVILLVFSVIASITFLYTNNMMILFVSLSILPQCLIASYQSLYQAWGRFTGYALVNVLPKIVLVAFTLTLYFWRINLTGNIIIWISIVANWLVAIYLICEYIFSVHGVRRGRVFSKTNFLTLWNGFLLMIGNYINLLFHSIDKMFVVLLYSTYSFAMYSFAMSMQNIMTIFITALAYPFYPRLASEDIAEDLLVKIRNALFVFGSYSGCAYYVVSIVIKTYINKYIDSLCVVSVFFAVFPILAVINVLYINLFKIRRMIKTYIFELVIILIISICMNGLSAYFSLDYYGISVATMITYFVWFFVAQRSFPDIKTGRRECLYLSIYLCIYFSVMHVANELFAFLVYFTVISIVNYCIYKDSIIFFITKFTKSKRAY